MRPFCVECSPALMPSRCAGHALQPSARRRKRRSLARRLLRLLRLQLQTVRIKLGLLDGVIHQIRTDDLLGHLNDQACLVEPLTETPLDRVIFLDFVVYYQ